MNSAASLRLRNAVLALGYAEAFLGVTFAAVLMAADERKEPEDYLAMTVFALLFGFLPLMTSVLAQISKRPVARAMLMAAVLVWPAAAYVAIRYA